MIIIRLIGGIGNQMFQYAAAKRLAVERKAELKLDVSAFDQYKLRQYRLNHFQINEAIIPPDELVAFKSKLLRYRIPRAIEKLFPYYSRRNFYERTAFIFDENILRTPETVCLSGYFQNEAYFKPIEPLIRQNFTLKNPYSPSVEKLISQIQSQQSISIHIRRGDYVSNPETNRLHGLLPLTYYDNCVSQITAQIKTPHFFVFSDDIAWAQTNLKIDYPVTWVSAEESLEDYEELALMSVCKHHIIANSSFSWWGAWLCSNPDKIVFAPAKWTADSRFDYAALLPSGWISL